VDTVGGRIWTERGRITKEAGVAGSSAGSPAAESFVLEPGSTRFAALDDRWLAQVSDFVRQLDREVGGVSQPAQPVPGAKGELSSIVLTLGSAGVFTTAAEFFKAWVGRGNGTRSLKVSWNQDGSPQSVELTGGDLDEASIDRIANSVASRFEAKA
jgi:hypothetical protein